MDIVREFDIVLWTIANFSTALNVIFGGEYARDKNLEGEVRNSFYIWCAFFGVMLTANILSMVWRLFIIELYGPGAAEAVEFVSFILLDIAWLLLLYRFDYKFRPAGKPYFFYLMIGSAVLGIFVAHHHNLVLDLIYVFTVVISFSTVPLTFLMIAKQTRGYIRTNSYRYALSLILFGLGLFFQIQNIEPYYPEIVEAMGIMAYVIAPSLITLSQVLLFFANWDVYYKSLED